MCPRSHCYQRQVNSFPSGKQAKVSFHFFSNCLLNILNFAQEEEESPSEADKTSQDLVEIPSVVKDVSAKPLPGSLTDGSSPPPEPESQEQPVQRPERQIHSAYSQWEVAKEPEP